MFKTAPLTTPFYVFPVSAENMSASSQPLSPSEKVLLSALLARVHGTDEEPEVPTPSSFAVIENETFHGMGEAAKRRTDEPTGESELKRSYVTKIKDEVVGHTPKGKPIILPQGVNDLASWGRTIIMFGKFAAKKGAPEITYKEVFDSKNAEDVRYVRWVKGQVEGASGHLLDLSLYFHARESHDSMTQQMPMIPGTDSFRRLKWAVTMNVT